MADQFAMEPGLGNFPDLVNEVASQLNELATQLNASGGSAIKEGDCDPIWDGLWIPSRESLQNLHLSMSSLADGWASAGSNVQASDGG